MEKNRYLPDLQKLREQFGFDLAMLATVISGMRRPFLTWVSASGNHYQDFQRIVLESGKGIAGGVQKSGRVMLIQDAFQEMTSEELAEHPVILAENIFCSMAVPLWKEECVHGVLLLGYRSANRISEAKFQAVMDALMPQFAGMDVKPASISDVIRKGQEAENAPIYELMYYPVLQAREAERRQIARELHDGILQDVLSVQMMLRMLKYQPTAEAKEELLEKADAWLGTIQNEIRSISASLRPVALDDWGLVASLHSRFERMEEVYPVQIQFHQNIKNRRYSYNIETAFYRVCQEAVANACKYAECDTIEVQLEEADGRLCMEIRDTGRGFFAEKPEIKGGGQGISDMLDWAELIDGTLSIDSAPGVGSRIRMSAPVRPVDGQIDAM